MKKVLIITLLTGFFSEGFSQINEVGMTSAVGNTQGSISISFQHDWELWKSKKFAVGAGARFTSYFGANQYYITAPAELTSGSTGPFVIFKENIEQNIDTFLIKSPQVNALNLMINLRYRFNEKIMVGFNIDVVGFSFGSSARGNYINGAEGAMLDAKPTAFNILLISDNDQGSLNSELYGKYFWNETWGVKLGAQFLFTEYTTESEVQQYPQPNDRFRKKSLMAAIGITYKLN
jgi:long-subunit fatty acid transport protein